MIRLCIDGRMINSSGIGTCIRNLIPFLSQPPFKLTMLTDSEPSKERSLHFPCAIYSIKEQLYFPWKIPACDLFWSPHYNVPLLPVKSRLRVVTIHDVCHLAQPLSKLKKLISRFLLHGACIKSDRVITDSNFSKSEIIKYLGCSKNKIDVIYPGVDREEFSPTKNGDEIKNKYNLQFPYFLFVGNFKTHKNLESLIKAFELIKSPNCHLVLVGKHAGLKSSDSASLKLIQNSPMKHRIRLLGDVSKAELPLLYASSVALVFPSLYEGFGLPPLEAMASGCPVLASDAASIPEVCSDAAIFFSPLDVENLALKMNRILNDDQLSKRLIFNGFRRCKEFSWQETGNKYRTLFEKLCLR